MMVVRHLLCDAREFAEHAKNLTIEDPDEGLHEDRTLALAYAAACTAKYSAAQAIYTLYPGGTLSLSELFRLFNEFTQEILSDYKENHSRQQVINIFYDIDNLHKELFPNETNQ